MRIDGFRQAPVWWVRDNHSIKRFRGGGDSGTSIAALKVLLGLCALCEMGSYIANASFQKIQDVTGLSRPMVVRGIYKLEEEDIISVDRRGYINVYRLESSEDDTGWAKVPCLKMHDHLLEMPNRGEAALAALKIYIYLLSLRPSRGNVVSVTYITIRKRTGIQPKWLRAGLDILINHLLIHVLKTEEVNQVGQNLANRYYLLGDLKVGQSHIR